MILNLRLVTKTFKRYLQQVQSGASTILMKIALLDLKEYVMRRQACVSVAVDQNTVSVDQKTSWSI